MITTGIRPLVVTGLVPEGVNVIEDTCSACGERNPAGSQFCLFCGVYLGWEERSKDPGSTTPAVHPPNGSHSTAADASEVRPRSTGGPATEELAVRPPPTAPLPVVGVGGVPEAAGVDCPDCHTPNDRDRRFCRRCGTALHPPVGAPSPARPRLPWWRRLWLRIGNPEERAARRSYRRSLPGLYRWRRRVLVLLALLVVGGGLTIAGRNPARLVTSAWHDVRGDVVQVDDVSAVTVLAKGATEKTPAGFAVDGDSSSAWTTAWVVPAAAPACGASTGTAGLRLTFPDTRVREIRLVAGVTDPSQRPLELLPKTVHITASDGSCVTAELSRSATAQTVPLDTGEPVSSLTVTVASTYPAKDPGQRTRAQVSLTEVSIWSRPE